MRAVLLGDIVNSRKVAPSQWMPALKALLDEVGPSPSIWEIFRGDSFQVECDPGQALALALRIKSLVKTHRELDVRISIGIGEIEHRAPQITQSAGTAFVRSGEVFDKKSNQRLTIKTGDDKTDEHLSVVLNLIGHIADNWKPETARTVYESLSNPDLQQKDLAKLINRAPATVSVALKRAGYSGIDKAVHHYKNLIGCLN